MSAAGNDGKEILGSEQSDHESESYDQDPGGVHEERTRQRSIGQTAVFEIPQPGEDVEQWSPEKMHAFLRDLARQTALNLELQNQNIFLRERERLNDEQDRAREAEKRAITAEERVQQLEESLRGQNEETAKANAEVQAQIHLFTEAQSRLDEMRRQKETSELHCHDRIDEMTNCIAENVAEIEELNRQLAQLQELQSYAASPRTRLEVSLHQHVFRTRQKTPRQFRRG